MLRITIKNLIECDPWQLARDNRLEYSGDYCPIPHWGAWYETSNWSDHGYADCVRITESEGQLWVERGTINRPHDIVPCLNCCGWEPCDNEPTHVRQSGEDSIKLTPQIEVESVLAYQGMEVDNRETFKEGHNGYDERAIMRVVKDWLLSIVPTDPLPPLADIRALLIELKRDIDDDYRADDDIDIPSMCVTIGADGRGQWSYQTGDNSYTGSAYHYPHWAVVTLTRRSNCTELAADVLDQLADLVAQSGE